MKKLTTTAIGALMLAGPAFADGHAVEMHVIMCGDEVFPADAAAVAAFDESRDDVTINLEGVPWGTCQDKSLTLAAAGDPPSIAYMGSRTLRQLAANGLIEPIEIGADQQASYQPGVLNTVTVEGQYWGLPHAFSTKALYINCDIVEAAGAECVAPTTWAEMTAMAQAVVDNTDAAGIGLAGKDFDNTMHQFLNYLYSNGGSVINPATGEVELDSPQTREALEFYASLVPLAQDGVLEWERDAMVDLFNDGQIAMYINGPWGRGRHNEEINQIIVPVPAGPSGPSGTILITDSIVVFSGTGHEDVALELAQILTSGQAQYELDLSWGLTPILQYENLGIEDPFYIDDAFWEVFTGGISTGGPEPLVEDFKSLQAVFVNMIQGAILEEDSIDSLVTIAAEELADAL